MLSTTSKAKPLKDVFPEDPTQPAYSMLANSGSPFSIPWPNEPVGNITLGSGFHSSELGATDVQTPFQTKAAFSEASLAERVRFSPVSGARSTFYKAVTSDAQNSAEHLSVSFKGGSGGKVLGASVNGKYNKEVMSNRAALKASIQATIRTGTIYIEGPRFSLDALADIRRQRFHQSTSFPDVYGDYYVGSLKLGADAGVLVSSASTASSTAESLDIKAKVSVLWWDIEANVHEASYSAETWSKLNVTAFDTLTGSNVSDASLKVSPQEVAEDYIRRANELEQRVGQEMGKFKLKHDQHVDLDLCQKLCESGLVVEMTLVPYNRARDFVAAISARD